MIKKPKEFFDELNFVNEKEHDHIYMSKKHIKQLIDDVKIIDELIEGKEELDDWIESHITVAAQNISDVKKSLMYKEEEEERMTMHKRPWSSKTDSTFTGTKTSKEAKRTQSKF